MVTWLYTHCQYLMYFPDVVSKSRVVSSRAMGHSSSQQLPRWLSKPLGVVRLVEPESEGLTETVTQFPVLCFNYIQLLGQQFESLPYLFPSASHWLKLFLHIKQVINTWRGREEGEMTDRVF